MNIEILKELVKETKNLTHTEILQEPLYNFCACLGPISDLQKKLNLCNCAFLNYVYQNKEMILEYRKNIKNNYEKY
jgi:hypothetical protein